jgi:hypothetical protein
MDVEAVVVVVDLIGMVVLEVGMVVVEEEQHMML